MIGIKYCFNEHIKIYMQNKIKTQKKKKKNPNPPKNRGKKKKNASKGR